MSEYLCWAVEGEIIANDSDLYITLLVETNLYHPLNPEAFVSFFGVLATGVSGFRVES